MTKPLTQPEPKPLAPEPRTWVGHLWNRLGFHTPAQRRALNQITDARLHEARLRRLEENGGLDPEDPADYMQLRINRYHEEEAQQRRAKAIRELAQQILAQQLPNHTRHMLHSHKDAQQAIEQATRIYDLTHRTRVERP